jgi:citrate synthase
MLLDPEQKIARPRQVYTGAKRRNVPGFIVKETATTR